MTAGIESEALDTNEDVVELQVGEPPDIRGAKVLIIGINYAPEPTGIAPYTTGMAEYLASAGAAVTVITGVPHYPAWKIAPEHRSRLRSAEMRNGVEVIRVRHTVPRRMTALRRAIYEGTFFMHAAAVGRRQDADLVLAVSPALGGAAAAAIVSRRTGSPLVTVVQDLMAKAAGESGISGGHRTSGLAARIEGFALRRAQRVLVVSDGFRDGVESYGIASSRIGQLRNWTHIEPSTIDRDEARRRLGWSTKAFLAVHTGNMGFKQHLENVIDASRLVGDEDETEFVLVGDGSQRAHLERYAVTAPRTRVLDPVDSATYALVLAAADVLLINERATVAEMSLPSKLTSYLAAGRPVVAAVAHGGTTSRELARTGAAVVVPSANPEALAAAVASLRHDAAARVQLGFAGARYARSVLSRDGSLGVLHRALPPLLAAREGDKVKRPRARGAILLTVLTGRRARRKADSDATVLRVVTRASATGAYGGPFTTALAQVEALANAGVPSTLFAGATPGDEPAISVKTATLRVQTSPAHQIPFLPANVGYASWTAVSAMWREVRSATVVHVSLGREILPILAGTFAVASRKRLVVQTHGMVQKDGRLSTRILDAIVVRRLFRLADVRIALTSDERVRLTAWDRSGASVAVLGNTVETADADEASRQARVVEVLFLARLQARKRVTDFIAAAAKANAEGWLDRYVIVGPDGGEGGAVREADRLLPNLRYEGAVGPEEVTRRVARSEVFVQASYDEPWGNVLATALAVGIATIVTESAALSDLIAEHDAGLVVPDGDPVALATAVHSLLTDPDRRQVLGSNARSLAREHFDRATLATKVLDLYGLG